MKFLMLFLSNRKYKIIYNKFSLLLLYDVRLSDFIINSYYKVIDKSKLFKKNVILFT